MQGPETGQQGGRIRREKRSRAGGEGQRLQARGTSWDISVRMSMRLFSPDR